MSADALGTRLLARRLAAEPEMGRWLGEYSLEAAHRAPADIALEPRYLQEATRYFFARRLRLLDERLGSARDGLQFLDVGDSDGLFLAKLGGRGVGLNTSPAACAQIRANGVRALRADVEHLPFRAGAFDVVLSFETLEHVLNPGAGLRELARVARGKIYVSIPGVARTLVHPRIRGSRPGDNHVVEWSDVDFRALVTHLRLRVTHAERVEFFAAPRRPAEWVTWWVRSTRDQLGGCFKYLQIYELERTEDEVGLDEAAYHRPYQAR